MSTRASIYLVAASTLAISLAVRAPMAHAGGNQSIVGLWLYTITSTDNSFSPFQTLETFSREGTVLADANIDLNPQTLSSPTHGVWSLAGNRAFHQKSRAFSYDQNANPNGMYFIDETDTVSQDGNSLSGTCSFSIVGNNGQTIFGPADCTTTATRITP
jgi:hypothetical protein